MKMIKEYLTSMGFTVFIAQASDMWGNLLELIIVALLTSIVIPLINRFAKWIGLTPKSEKEMKIQLLKQAIELAEKENDKILVSALKYQLNMIEKEGKEIDKED